MENISLHEQTIAIVNDIFRKLIAMCPAFRNSWPTEEEFKDTKKEWVMAFEDAKLHDLDLINKGLNEFRLSPSPFIPSPGQFISLCIPEPKWQTDTRSPEFRASNLLESDADKARRMEMGKKHCSEILNMLRG